MEKALVCLPREERRSSTIFGGFFTEVLKHHRLLPPTRIDSSQQLLIDFPIEQIILSGLWVVIQKIANLYNLPLTNEVQIGVVADYTDRLVSVGMSVTYSTFEYAALSFEEQIVDVLKRAVSLGYRPSMDITRNAWENLRNGNERLFSKAIAGASEKQSGPLAQFGQMPAALFFANLTKKAREYLNELKILATELKQENTIPVENRSEYTTVNFVEASITHDVGSWAAWLNPPNSADQSSFQPAVSLVQMAAELNRCFEKQKIFRSFRFNTNLWPKLYDEDYLIEQIWLNTQILLSFIDASLEQEAITGTQQYFKAVKNLKNCPVELAVQKALGRLQKRTINQLSLSETERLKKIIASHISIIQTEWITDFFDFKKLTDVFIHAAGNDLTCDSETALRIATHPQPTQLETADHLGIDTASWLDEQVFPIIKWESLSQSDVDEIIHAEIMPISTLLTYFSRLPQPVQRRAANQLIKNEALEAAAVNHFVEKRLVELTPELVHRHLEKFSTQLFEMYLPKLLESLRARKIVDGKKDQYFLLWKILGQAAADIVISIFSDLVWRDVLYEMFFEVNEEIRNNPQSYLGKIANKVHKKLGRLYYFLPLAMEIRGTVEPIKDLIRGKERIKINDWGTELVVHSYLYVAQAQIAHIFATISEEEAFRWAYAHEADVDERWKQFNQFRAGLKKPKKTKPKK